jgi:hypothetical protein
MVFTMDVHYEFPRHLFYCPAPPKKGERLGTTFRPQHQPFTSFSILISRTDSGHSKKESVKWCILDMRYPEVNLTSHLSDIPRLRDSSNQGARFNHRTFRQVAAAGSLKGAQPPSISHG